MPRTRYDEDRASFSEAAHQAAQSQFYPDVFDVDRERLEFVDVAGSDADEHKLLDRKLGVDKLVRVDADHLDFPRVFSVQERFRRNEYRHFRDVTTTLFNNASGEVSEAVKIIAQLFVYGFYNDDREILSEAVAVNVPRLFMAHAAGAIEADRQRNNKGQDFLAFKLSELRFVDAIEEHMMAVPLSGALPQQKKLDWF